MIGSTGATGQPVRLNERTGRAVLARVGLYAAVVCVGALAITLGYGWLSWGLAYWAICWLVGWLANTLAVTEWTIAGHELRRRRWLSWPGSKPSAPLELGPQVEIVHEISGRWRLWPGGYAIDVQPWQASRLVGAMERAGVRVDDWRGAWTRRHRLLNAVGLVVLCGAAVALLVSTALVPLRPGSVVSFVAYGACVGALVLGLAIDFLPWQMRKSSAQDG